MSFPSRNRLNLGFIFSHVYDLHKSAALCFGPNESQIVLRYFSLDDSVSTLVCSLNTKKAQSFNLLTRMKLQHYLYMHVKPYLSTHLSLRTRLLKYFVLERSVFKAKHLRSLI